MALAQKDIYAMAVKQAERAEAPPSYKHQKLVMERKLAIIFFSGEYLPAFYYVCSVP